MLARVARFARTIRHLRPRQAVHLVLRLVRGDAAPQSSGLRWSPERAGPVLEVLRRLGPVAGAAEARRVAAAWRDGRLIAADAEVTFGGWKMPGPSALWRYHLHYHDHLADLAFIAAGKPNGAERDAILGRLALDLSGWLAACGRGGSPEWDAYPVSVRLVNWLRIESFVVDSLPPDLREAMRTGIARHVDHLLGHLEWHLDGNHLLRNAWAVAFGSLVLDGADASARRASAMARFEGLISEQVLDDGWHVERSPMYHARALRDALELQAAATAARESLGAASEDRIARMRGALPWMMRNDGSLWPLNDSTNDFGVDLAPLLSTLDAVDGVRAFPDAGVVCVADRAHRDRLRLDLGAPAPTHQPGHAHGGALGFELELSGRPIIVDGGCSGYDADPWRSHLRGSAAHSTVTIDGLDQSEFWATFRVGGRARVDSVESSGTARDFRASAACHPWHTPSIRHHRRFERLERLVRLTDTVHGARGRRVEAWLQLDPACAVERVTATTFELRSYDVSARLTIEGAAEATLHRGERDPVIGWRALRFGEVVPAWTVRIRATDGAPWTTTIEPR